MRIPGFLKVELFLSEDIDDLYGFVYLITNLTNGRKYIGRKYFWSHRKPPGKKRRVKKNLIGKSIMGLVQNLKKTLNDWGDKILVELSSAYIKRLAKQTSKKQGNSLSTESSPNLLTQEDPSTTIVTSSQDTERTTMTMETEEIVKHLRDWALSKIDDLHELTDQQIYDDEKNQ